MSKLKEEIEEIIEDLLEDSRISLESIGDTVYDGDGYYQANVFLSIEDPTPYIFEDPVELMVHTEDESVFFPEDDYELDVDDFHELLLGLLVMKVKELQKGKKEEKPAPEEQHPLPFLEKRYLICFELYSNGQRNGSISGVFQTLREISTVLDSIILKKVALSNLKDFYSSEDLPTDITLMLASILPVSQSHDDGWVRVVDFDNFRYRMSQDPEWTAIEMESQE